MYDVFFDIEEELKKLPDKPGVYIMHDENHLCRQVNKPEKQGKTVFPVIKKSYQQNKTDGFQYPQI